MGEGLSCVYSSSWCVGIGLIVAVLLVLPVLWCLGIAWERLSCMVQRAGHIVHWDSLEALLHDHLELDGLANCYRRQLLRDPCLRARISDVRQEQ